MAKYQVVVGNIGTVYDGNMAGAAQAVFDEYMEQSRNNVGRAAGEPVTIMEDGNEKWSYTPEEDMMK